MLNNRKHECCLSTGQTSRRRPSAALLAHSPTAFRRCNKSASDPPPPPTPRFRKSVPFGSRAASPVACQGVAHVHEGTSEGPHSHVQPAARTSGKRESYPFHDAATKVSAPRGGQRVQKGQPWRSALWKWSPGTHALRHTPILFKQ